MLQFFIGLSILLLVVALMYWSERLIFGKSHKDATDMTFGLATYSVASDVVGFFVVFLIGIALIPLVCFLVGKAAWRLVVLPIWRLFKRKP